MVSQNDFEHVRQTIRLMSDEQKSALARELSCDGSENEHDDSVKQAHRATSEEESPLTEAEIAERRMVLKEILDVADDIRSRTHLEGMTIRELIEEGRRF